MTDQFVGQIDLFAFDFAPKGWLACAGQPLIIAQHKDLFNAIGTAFGGDGKTWFALPDLRGGVAMHVSGTTAVGQRGGEATHTLTLAEIPPHGHSLNVDAATAGTANGTMPGSSVVLGQSSGTSPSTPTFGLNVYGSAAPSNTLDISTIGTTGGQPHPNMMPSLGLNYCIAIVGQSPR